MLPVVTLTGSPYRRGLAHGRAGRERIAHNIDAYFRRFAFDAGLDADAVHAAAAPYGRLIDVDYPDYAAEMRGVADGAGADLRAVVALNVRYEILYHAFSQTAQSFARADGCTAFAVQPSASADGHLLLCQNWDWYPEVRGLVLHRPGEKVVDAAGDDSTIETTVAIDTGVAIDTADASDAAGNDLASLCFTEAGIVGGKIGLNSAGVGLAINGLISEGDDAGHLATPFHVRCDAILRQRDLGAAAAIVTAGRRACSANFLIAQTPDRVVDLEAAPGAVRALEPDDGVIAHANHFLDAAGMGIVEPITDTRPSSVHRYDRCRALLAGRDGGGVTIAAAMAFLRDHDGRPQSLCRHVDARRPPTKQSATLASVLMDLHAGRMWISDGPPCENPYLALALDGEVAPDGMPDAMSPATRGATSVRVRD